ncbi:hypothetical protein L2E82_35322 [Cichorium intybus]|uniref:Uncharacterized protein n=1 Tax=Cichorium intybus TaxID=13427 RepID=A0ACB9BNI5_CICIN|nr:hypothetical protein L2E82_35322 [Cichorium intybus]
MCPPIVRILQRLLWLHLGFFEGRSGKSVGDVAYRITAEALDAADTIYALLNTIVPSSLQLLAMGTQMLVISRVLSLVSAMVIPLMVFVNAYFGEELREISNKPNDLSRIPPALDDQLRGGRKQTRLLVEQLWNFAWPAAIALLHPSLLPVAVMGFCTKVAVIAGGPLVGKLMDLFPCVPAYNFLSTIQAFAQVLSAGMIIQAHMAHASLETSVLMRPWFIILVLAGTVERLSRLALGVAVERDWVVLLAGTNRLIALDQENAIISRNDLLCEFAGASLFGILLSKYEIVTSLKLAAAVKTREKVVKG